MSHGASIWNRRFQVFGPLAVGVVLVAVFIVLLVKNRTEDEATARVTAPEPTRDEVETPRDPRFAVQPSEVPLGSPTDRETARESRAPGMARWGDLGALPDGWDADLAMRIAALFGQIDFDPAHPETYLPAGKAWDDLHALLESLDASALPTLAHLLNREPTYLLRKQLLKGIGHLGESEAAALVLRDYFLERSVDLKARVEMNQAIAALGALKNDTAFDTMVEFLDSPDLPLYFKDKLVVELGEHPRREEGTELFKSLMLESRDNNIRNHASQALGKFGTPNDLPSLYDAYDQEKRRGHWIVRQTILGTIGKIGDSTSVPFLEQEARFAKEDGVRLSAASALRRVGTGNALQILQELAQTEKNPRVRSRIHRWLGE